MQRYKIFLLISLLVLSCREKPSGSPSGMEYASWFDISSSGEVLLYQPASPGVADTLRGQVERLVCMSSSYVGFLDAIGAGDAVVGVSGKAFLPESNAVEVGYDAALDYEAILSLKPDLVLSYMVSSVEPPYLAKLRALGIKTVLLSEHLENHPLARAEYVKLFGALTGRREKADSLFSAVKERYLSLSVQEPFCKVLMNIPYAEQWFIPGGDNYMTRIIRDAGGEVLGAVEGQSRSSTIDLETAYLYSYQADFWLHPGWCSTKEQLRAVHPLFAKFPVLEKEVWNNTLQTTPGGGNRYWETGPVRPDHILEDLVGIFSGRGDTVRHYYKKVE